MNSSSETGKILILSVFMAVSSAQDITLKAPSLSVNCGCQCSNYAFVDTHRRTQGNCNSADQTGAKWCYVDRGHTCQDSRRSGRRDNYGRRRQISYEACATPRCGGLYVNNKGFRNKNKGFGNNRFGKNKKRGFKKYSRGRISI
ncbi:unnamed protein product [Lepeophtheirus salmonis]|uniref:(salmon louse) hypothetical protein n=1 Tax=Lepeophtheirus salmonis TaxID=72036 RepID=A0A7R8H9E2_LEPSM|nr:unnamed protein product [Lepeophtheirus salmonis]CAF2953756.1 unnamed protein product [Lepeophtheirus salmonis]